ncbi:MAG: short chain dehydrogenase [Chloroflexi bacterium]|nr:short chain dehydrogenase [Chloroflexota bacterium]
MDILIIGAFGKIGSKVVEALQENHDIITAALTRGDVRVDYRDAQSIRAMYEAVGTVDAVVFAAGGGHFWGSFDEIGEEQVKIGLHGKLLGQINTVLIGTEFVRDGGSFTLTSGYRSQHPGPNTVVVGTVNAAVDAFVRHAAVSLPRGIRINTVSPAHVVETEAEARQPEYVTRKETAAAYVQSIEGNMTGQMLPVWNIK